MNEYKKFIAVFYRILSVWAILYSIEKVTYKLPKAFEHNKNLRL